MAVLVRYAALAVTGSSWKLLAVFLTHLKLAPNAGMVLAVKVIGSYWQLLAVNGSYWQLMAVNGSSRKYLTGSYNYWQLLAVNSSWQLRHA